MILAILGPSWDRDRSERWSGAVNRGFFGLITLTASREKRTEKTWNLEPLQDNLPVEALKSGSNELLEGLDVELFRHFSCSAKPQLKFFLFFLNSGKNLILILDHPFLKLK